jgi:hypothetical protein
MPPNHEGTVNGINRPATKQFVATIYRNNLPRNNAGNAEPHASP